MSNFYISGRQVMGLKLFTSAPIVLSIINSEVDLVTSQLGVISLWRMT